MTLGVGLDTFRPVTAADLADHPLHSEPYAVTEEAAAAVDAARADGRRIVAVGTTTVRVLETVWGDPQRAPLQGRTRLFITPGRPFAVTGALVTNFHLPRSTLLAMVMAFAGADPVRSLYRTAVRGALPLLQLRRCHAAPVSDHFRITATDGAARAGVLQTAHGPVETPVFMPVGTKASVKAMLPGELRDLGATIVLGKRLPPALPPGGRADRRARRPAPVQRLGRADPHRFRRFPGVFAAPHRRRASTTRECASGRSTTAPSSTSPPSWPCAIQRLLGSDIAMAFDECPPAGVDRGPYRGRRAPHRHLGAAEPRPAAGRGPARIRDRPGRHRPGSAAAQRRGHPRGGVRRLRRGRALGGRGARPDARDAGRDRRDAPGRPAPLPDGGRRPAGPRGGDRPRRGHVRLRASHPARAHRLGPRSRRADQPAKRRICRRSAGRSSKAAPVPPAPASRAPTSAT